MLESVKLAADSFITRFCVPGPNGIEWSDYALWANWFVGALLGSIGLVLIGCGLSNGKCVKLSRVGRALVVISILCATQIMFAIEVLLFGIISFAGVVVLIVAPLLGVGWCIGAAFRAHGGCDAEQCQKEKV